MRSEWGGGSGCPAQRPGGRGADGGAETETHATHDQSAYYRIKYGKSSAKVANDKEQLVNPFIMYE